MWKSIKQIDDAIINADIGPKEIDKSLMNLRIANMITYNQFYKTKQLIADIIKMRNKYRSLLWYVRTINELSQKEDEI